MSVVIVSPRDMRASVFKGNGSIDGATWRPIAYPLITVVDSTERHWTDNQKALIRLFEDGLVLETPGKREADALILSMVGKNDWYDCEIISNDYRMLTSHEEMLPKADAEWYAGVQQTFTINQQTEQIEIVPASSQPRKTKKPPRKSRPTGEENRVQVRVRDERRRRRRKRRANPTARRRKSPGATTPINNTVAISLASPKRNPTRNRPSPNPTHRTATAAGIQNEERGNERRRSRTLGQRNHLQRL